MAFEEQRGIGPVYSSMRIISQIVIRLNEAEWFLILRGDGLLSWTDTFVSAAAAIATAAATATATATAVATATAAAITVVVIAATAAGVATIVGTIVS